MLVKRIVIFTNPHATFEINIQFLFLGSRLYFFGSAERVDIQTTSVENGLSERDAGPGSVEVERSALYRNRSSADGFGSHVADQIFQERQEGIFLRIRPVELNHGELRIVRIVNAFVPKTAANFKDPLKAANQKPLQIELRSNAQVQVDIEGVVMGRERPSVGTTWDRLEHGCFHFHEVALFQKRTHGSNRFGTQNEPLAHFGIAHQIELPFPLA